MASLDLLTLMSLTADTDTDVITDTETDVTHC